MTGTVVRLYEVADAYLAALAGLADRDDLAPEIIADTLEAVQGEVQVKAVNVAAFVRNVEIEADALADRAAMMAERAKRAQKVADGLKAYLATHLMRCGLKEAAHEGVRVALVKNPPAVHIEDAAKVPDEFKRAPPAPPPPPAMPDKQAIAAALKAGLPVEGCVLLQSYRVKIEG